MNPLRNPLSPVVRMLVWLLLGLILVVAGCEMAGWPFLSQPLQHVLQARLHREVRITGPFHLQLLGGIRLQVGSVKIAAPQAFKVPYFIDAQGLELQLRYRDLWALQATDPYRVAALRADHLHTYLIRDASKAATWAFELDEQGPPRPFPLIEQLSVKQGEAQVEDAVTQARLTVTFFTEEGEGMRTPESRVTFKGQFRQRPLQGTLVTQGFLPIATQDAQAPPVHSRGQLSYGALQATFRGAVYDLFGQQQVRGSVTVQGSTLADAGELLNLTLPRTGAFHVRAEVVRKTDRWQVSIPAARIGRSQLSGAFVYDLAPETPMLTGQLKGRLLMLADLAPAFGAVPSTEGKVRQADKLFPDQSLDFATYGRMNADIDIALDAVDLGQAFKQRIAPLKLRLTLLKHKLSLAELQASTAQGTLTGALAIDAHDSRNPDLPPQVAPDWDIRLDVHDIQLDQWLKVSPPPTRPAASPHAKADAPAYIRGKLSGKARLQGQGRSTAALLRSLNGQLSLMVRQGEISHLLIEAAGLDIAQAVGVMLRGDQPLPMQCAVMDWRAKQGRLTPEVALIDTPVTTVAVHGEVNLGDEQLNLKLQASPRNFSPLTVRSPIRVTGPFVAPQLSVSPGPIAARVAGGLLLGLLNPLAAILPFLDPGEQASVPDGGCQQTIAQLRARPR